MTTPEWVPLHQFGCSGYSINQYGDVMNTRSGKMKKHSVHKSGTRYVLLCKDDGGKISVGVAKAVASIFLDRNVPERWNTVIYKDGNMANCAASNLAWRPRSYAIRFNKHYRGEHTPVKRSVNAVDGSGEFLRYFITVDDAAAFYGLLPKDIYLMAINGTQCYYHPGLYFEFA